MYVCIYIILRFFWQNKELELELERFGELGAAESTPSESVVTPKSLQSRT